VSPPGASAIVAAVREALADLEPSLLVAAALGPAPPRPGRVRVISAGKAALAMAAGALRAWDDRIEDVLAVTVDGLDAGVSTASGRVPVHVARAAHPLPDERSVEAATQALARAADLGPDDLLLVLVSGGASALLAMPSRGAALGQKAALVARLLGSGAPIEAVNLVRRHVSRIKGGRLARAARAARVSTLVLSDVVGGAACDVGSGPSLPDPTTIEDARAVLRRWAPELAGEVEPWLAESLKPGERADPEPRVLADPDALARAVARRLAAAGFATRALPADRGTCSAVARRRAHAAERLAPGEALVVACEPTLTLPRSPGRGGRAGWTALAAASRLPDDAVLLCAASDGVDGSSGAAGALVTRAAVARADQATIRSALARCDDAPLHRALGTAVGLGPTGTNLTDVHVVARLRS
jgi:hydroxypyruvate reductase